MSVNGRMSKDNETCVYVYVYTYIYIYNDGILFSHKKGYPAICNNIDEPKGHYI